jgi:hypothetical protein
MNIEYNVYHLINQTIEKVIDEFNNNEFADNVVIHEITPKNTKPKTLIKCKMKQLLELAVCKDNWILSDECLSDIQICTTIVSHRLYTDTKLCRYIRRHGIDVLEGMAIHYMIVINSLFGGT